MPVDISEWPTKSDAMERLGVRLTQLNNLIKQRKLEVRLESRQGMPPLGRINPEDLQREAERRKPSVPAVHVMPEPETPSRFEGIPDPPQFDEVMALSMMFQHREVVTLDEAARISGYGRGILERYIAAGRLSAKRAGRHGSLVIRRADLAGLWDRIE